jgi:hypothetical protein
MPFGMGPLGWAYLQCWHPRYGWSFPHGWPGFYPYWSPWGTPSKEQEIAMLNDQASMLEQELSQIRTRLEELQK